jgi:hypothetical protein
MSAPVRFLVLLVVGWAGMRAATLGYVPGFTVSFAKQAEPGRLPPVIPTQFPRLPPADVSLSQPWPEPVPVAYAYPPPATWYPQPYYVPYPVAAAAPANPLPDRAEWELPSQQSRGPEFYAPIPSLEDWQASEFAPATFAGGRSSPVPSVLAQAAAETRLDRIQMSSWALLRGAPSPDALAAGGTLGGSQAGARLTYAFNRWIAASLRTTSPIGGSRGAEIAGGLRLIPFRSIPIAITAERRQAISPHGGGRSAFALFAEGGLYRQPMPLNFTLDAYMQAGIVGLKSRDYFADGAFAFTRPVYKRFSAGFGIWGGVQPGLYRVDAGPRISFRVRDNIHAHLDWRQRLVGNAKPASGPALTLAADF